MTNTVRLRLACVLASLFVAAGCGSVSRQPPLEVWDDMDRQPKYKPQAVSLLADGSVGDWKTTQRYPVPGTIARGYLKPQDAYHTGLENGQYVGRIPMTVDADLLKYGQQRFNTYCSPCHSRVGDGKGIVPAKSGWQATNLHEERIRNMADGDLFNVISYGRRSMPGYRFQMVERDRWAIAAYVRALQRTQIATIEDVPAELRSDLR